MGSVNHGEPRPPKSTEVSERKAEANRSWRLAKDIFSLSIIILIFFGVGYFMSGHVDAVRAALQRSENRTQGILIFVALGSLLVSVGIPRMWLCGIAGGLYGAVMGSGLGLLVSLIGSIIPYLVGRSVLKGIVKRRFGKRVNEWKEKFRKHAFEFTLSLRLLPGANATVTSMACGAARCPFGAYMLATTIGYVPNSVALAVLGSAAAKNSGLQIALTIPLLLISIFIPWWMTRKKTAT